MTTENHNKSIAFSHKYVAIDLLLTLYICNYKFVLILCLSIGKEKHARIRVDIQRLDFTRRPFEKYYRN